MQEKIVIIGGGIAALTAAFELSADPDWQERYAITVYQMGHRLGGKGASGRNRDRFDRIEEHGLHLLYGFYDNAFHVIRRCYEELGRPEGAPLATVDDAFRPHSLIVFQEQRGGKWQHQPLLFPRNAEVAGARDPMPSPAELIPRMLRYLVTLNEEQRALRARAGVWRAGGLTEEAFNTPPQEAGGAPGALRVLLQAAAKLADEVGALLARSGEGSAPRRDELIGRLLSWSRRAYALCAPWLQHSPELRIVWTAVDITLTMIRGMIADGLTARADVDWLELDDEDFRSWLRRHGASEESVNASTVSGVYAGAYSAGQEVGAGTMLHWTLRMLFTYRGAIFYKMQAGMGDTIFAPLYLVLRRRGVRFRFFHRLDQLRLAEDRARVASIEMGRQMVLRGDEYEPLVDVKGLPCWPSEPLYEQLVDGEALRASGARLEEFGARWPDQGGQLVLRAGEDFDRVVLAIGLGAVPLVCQELLADEGNPRFSRMVRSVKTTQTASAQLWFEPDLRGTGWHLPPPVVIPHAEPLDTWADLSHLLPRESFPDGEGPGSLAYLTAAMADDEPPPRSHDEADGYVKRQHDRVRRATERFLRESASHLWPAACTGPSLDLERLWSPEGGTGDARLAWQHFSPPVHPSDRYVLSVRGTTRHRLGAGESGYENLILCGDWVMNPMNLGCAEAAAMAGMQAARALGARSVVIHDDWLSARARRSPPAPRTRRYVERSLNESTAPPYHAAGVSMYSALVPADPERLRALLDDHLNFGDRVYSPLGPFAVFYAQDTRALSAADTPGHVPERDFGFMIPVAVCERRGGRLHAEGIAVYAPFLWVDLGAAVYGGREVHGFPKGLARLDFPDSPEGDVSLRVTAWLPPRGAAGDRAQPWREETLVEAKLVRAAEPWSDGAAWSSALRWARQLQRAGRDHAGRTRLLRALGHTLRSGSVRMVFLKQYRDAADPTAACYQAIVEATAARLGPARRTARLPGDLLLSVHRESGLLEQLGLCPLPPASPEARTATIRAIAASYMELDFTLGPGTVVQE